MTLTSLVVGAPPAVAHGAPFSPVSRAVACAPDGEQYARLKACQAAAAIGGTRQFTAWDNLRVANVAGQDRQVIPDGKLCSGGIPAYRGLDLPRADWPATRLTAGITFSFRYAETIPHEGTFELFVTKDGYDPTQPLRWSDLEPTPFLRVTNPPQRGNAYVFDGTLPRNKSGRHLIYTIWQNSSTPDTYYSCSDVDFRDARTAANPPATPKETSARTSADKTVVTSPTSAPPSDATSTIDPAPTIDAAPPSGAAPAANAAPAADSVTRTAAASGSSYGAALLYTAVGVAILAVAGLGPAAVRRRRSSTRS